MTASAKGAQPQELMVTIECPKCGEKTRTQVLASAYLGGWCIGKIGNRHKAVNYRVVKQ